MSHALLPALGTEPSHGLHNLWWVVLALVVFALVAPLAYLLGHNGGRGGD